MFHAYGMILKSTSFARDFIAYFGFAVCFWSRYNDFWHYEVQMWS